MFQVRMHGRGGQGVVRRRSCCHSSHDFKRLGLDLIPDHVRTLPAAEIARKHAGRPVPNAAPLDAFASLTRIVSLASVELAIRQRFPSRIADGNVAAARAAFELEAVNA